MDKSKLITVKLNELFEKYIDIKIEKISLENDTINIFIDNKKYVFFSNFDLNMDENYIPIYYWRNERRYIEFKNIINQKLVENPVGMRIKNIEDKNTNIIKNLFIKEIDLIEWTFEKKIVGVFASKGNEEYYNVIFDTENNIKINSEIGLTNTSKDISLHEVITQKGIILDTPVDTQIKHSSIYVYNNNKETEFNDVDFELYGLSYKEIGQVRFIFNYFLNGLNINDFIKKQNRYNKIIDAIKKSSIKNKKIFLSEV